MIWHHILNIERIRHYFPSTTCHLPPSCAVAPVFCRGLAKMTSPISAWSKPMFVSIVHQAAMQSSVAYFMNFNATYALQKMASCLASCWQQKFVFRHRLFPNLWIFTRQWSPMTIISRPSANHEIVHLLTLSTSDLAPVTVTLADCSRQSTAKKFEEIHHQIATMIKQNVLWTLRLYFVRWDGASRDLEG